MATVFPFALCLSLNSCVHPRYSIRPTRLNSSVRVQLRLSYSSAHNSLIAYLLSPIKLSLIMARATRSSAAHEKDKQTEPTATTAVVSARGKAAASKKRKRTSIADGDDQPASKQLRSGDVSIKEEGGASLEPEEQPGAEKLADLQHVGDVPINDNDAQKILDILEMCVYFGSMYCHTMTQGLMNVVSGSTPRVCLTEYFHSPRALPSLPALSQLSIRSVRSSRSRRNIHYANYA